MFPIVATLVVFILTLLLVYDWRKHSYWKSKGVPTPRYLPLIGHHHLSFVGTRWENIDKIYKKFKSNGFWGMYEGWKPVCFISDPALIREIMVKEADHFTDRRSMSFEGEERIFNEMLSVVKGEKWKSLRSLMSPTFTSGKLKGMFPLIDDKAKELIKHCEKEMTENSFVEIRSLFGYYTMDVIGSCAFGIDAHCLQQKEKSQFIQYTSNLLSFGKTKLMKLLILIISAKLYKALGLQLNKASTVPFFINVIQETVALRRKSGVKRGDFLDLMLEALDECERKGSDFKYPMTMNTVMSESLLFIIAGFDSTSTTLAYMAYRLAKNPGAQERLRKELQKVVEADGELNYQNVMEAQYLDACFSETLRIYPFSVFVERCCTSNFKLPGTDVEIPKDMLAHIPLWSVHRDPDYWEEPLSFIPDRFLPENKSNLIPYTYLPFGLGPRNCIGMRFVQMEVKLVMAKLIIDFELTLRPGYTEVVLESPITLLRPNKDGVQLVLEKVTRK